MATAAAAAVSAADGAKMVEALTDVAMTMAAVASSREVWLMVMATVVGRQWLRRCSDGGGCDRGVGDGGVDGGIGMGGSGDGGGAIGGGDGGMGDGVGDSGPPLLLYGCLPAHHVSGLAA